MQVSTASVEKMKLNMKQQKADKDLKFLADAIYKTLCKEGCQVNDIIGVSTQLISLVTTEIEDKQKNS